MIETLTNHNLICLTVLYLSYNMTSKFIIGFATGVFLSTKYDFKPYILLIEEKIMSIEKIKIEKEKEKEKVGWKFKWPWAENKYQ